MNGTSEVKRVCCFLPGARTVGMGLGLEILFEHRGAQAERRDLPGKDEVVIGHAAHPLDDHPEQREAGGRLAHLAAGLELERQAGDQREQLGRRVGLALLEGAGGAVVGEARGVLQQVEDGDLAPGGGQPAQVFVDRIAHLELAHLLQLQGRDGGEALRHRPDREHGTGRGKLVVGQAGAAVAGGARYIRCLNDRHGEPRHLIGHELGNALVDVPAPHRKVGLAARLGLGQGQRRRKQQRKNGQQTHETPPVLREVKPSTPARSIR